MKTLKTLGTSGNSKLPSTFQYYRNKNNVLIYFIKAEKEHEIKNKQWSNMLSKIEGKTFSSMGGFKKFLGQDIDSVLSQDGTYIAAILKNEGSIKIKYEGDRIVLDC